MADEGKLKIVIVTPAGEKLNGEFDEIIAPGELGEFGVMPGHIEFFTKGRPGVFTAISGGKTEYFAIGKGFIEVEPNRVQLVVQSAERAKDIDTERAQKAKESASKMLDEIDGNLTDPKWEEASLRFARAEARLAAAALAK